MFVSAAFSSQTRYVHYNSENCSVALFFSVMKRGFLVAGNKEQPQGRALPKTTATVTGAAQNDSTSDIADVYPGPAQPRIQCKSSKSSSLNLSADYQQCNRCKDGCNSELHQTIASRSLDVVASMDIDSPRANLGSEPRIAFVNSRDGNLEWGQIHDNTCRTYQAQQLVECALQSLI